MENAQRPNLKRYMLIGVVLVAAGLGACKKDAPAPAPATTNAPLTPTTAAAEHYGLPDAVYAALKEADDKGKAGDAEGMVKAAVAALGNTDHVTTSPDGKKAIIGGGNLFTRELRAYLGQEAFFYFEAGKGLVGWKTKRANYRQSKWSDDGRYVLYAGAAEGLSNHLYFTDTNDWKDTWIGTVARVDDGYEWDIYGDFICWLSFKPAGWGQPVPTGYYLPELRAYNLTNGAKHQALRVYEEAAVGPDGVVKVVLKKTPETMTVFEDFPLYKKYADKTFTCKKAPDARPIQ